MGFVLGYGAHCFELYGVRTWLVAFWTFVIARHAGTDCRRRLFVSFVFSILAMPASILGNELALKFGRHRAITTVMFCSAAVALLIGLLADDSPWLLMPLARLCDHGARRFRRAHLGHVDGRRSRQQGSDDGDAFDGRLQPVRAWRMGGRRSARRCRRTASASAWTAAFAVLAFGILLGPLALYWSRRPALPGRA